MISGAGIERSADGSAVGSAYWSRLRLMRKKGEAQDEKAAASTHEQASGDTPISDHRCDGLVLTDLRQSSPGIRWRPGEDADENRVQGIAEEYGAGNKRWRRSRSAGSKLATARRLMLISR